MISGKVQIRGREGHIVYLEPRVAVSVAGGSGVARTVNATMDTGFTGWLTLPPDIIRQLGLQYRGTRTVSLANGQEWPVELYLGFISWDDRILPRLIHQSDGNPLIGMNLMTGFRLTMDIRAGGDVVIEEIPTDPL